MYEYLTKVRFDIMIKMPGQIIAKSLNKLNLFTCAGY
jgi:hypothetical protein